MIELLTSYPEWVALRAGDVTRGIPGRFNRCPQIADMRELFDAWLAEQAEADRRQALAARVPELPAPRYKLPLDQTYNAMVERYGRPLGPFEEGTKWARFAGRSGGLDTRNELLEQVAASARRAMEHRRREAAMVNSGEAIE